MVLFENGFSILEVYACCTSTVLIFQVLYSSTGLHQGNRFWLLMWQQRGEKPDDYNLKWGKPEQLHWKSLIKAGEIIRSRFKSFKSCLVNKLSREWRLEHNGDNFYLHSFHNKSEVMFTPIKNEVAVLQIEIGHWGQFRFFLLPVGESNVGILIAVLDM